MKKLLLLATTLILLGAGCLRRVPPSPSSQSSIPSVPSLPSVSSSSSSLLQEKFPDRLDEGLNDLELLHDIP